MDHYTSEILPESFLKKYQKKKVNWGFNGLGYIIYKRTYARTLPDNIQEEWWQTVARCINGAQDIGAKYAKEEAQRLYDYVFNLKGCFSGRALWQLGSPLIKKYNIADAVLNCWVTKVSEVSDFKFIIMESMFGGGVGCNISREYTQELPRVKRGVRCRLQNTKDADYIIPDSKEGWAEIWSKIIETYLIGGKSFTYSAVCIRPEGEPLKTFGGIAPGPKPLIDGLEELCRILESREGKKLRTVDVADIICVGGEMIKSGGLRRTALLLGGDVDDQAYVRLKRWDLGNIPNYRANSNNSLICPKYEYLQDSFWDGYNGNGEPYGLINLHNCRKFGRAGESELDGFSLLDPDVILCNPCGEAILDDKSACNLAELVLPNIKSKEEMVDIATLLYKAQKAIAAMNYYHEESSDSVHRYMRLGLSVTGVCHKLEVVDEWCDFTYLALRKFDKTWSKENGWPQSLRLSVVQPSGTKSLMFGVTPGCHPGYSRYFIRRVRFDAFDPLVKILKDCGYKVDPEQKFDGSLNHSLLVAEFPCHYGNDVLISKDCPAVKQLDIAKQLQSKWADQSCSVTCYYNKEELSDIKAWLKDNYNKSVKTVSFLLHSEHGFTQAPYSEITKEEYQAMSEKLKPLPILQLADDGSELADNLECSSGSCPIR